ncbi:protein trichome birefringence-like 2 [Rutidosis leptorrhynchoides]|uniref:protein trichome birefringence-like 2 n=1 Tax=Rutidosis leptorrhynchoides TaxID=125765 RepID=UPI003A993F5D
MNLKKLFPITDQFPYFTFTKKKVVSGFSLGIASFFIILFIVCFNVSFKSPISNNFNFQGFDVNNKTSVISWPFSFTRNPAVKKPLMSSIIGDAHFSNFTEGKKNGSYEKDLDLKGTHLSNFSRDEKDGNFNGIYERNHDLEDTHFKNFTNDVKNGSFNGINVKSFDLEGTHLSNLTDNVKNGSLNTHLSNFTGDLKKDADGVFKLGNDSSFYGECDIFNGRWVRDDTKPYYPAGSCPYIDRDFDCHLNKRPDDEYVKWKWQPYGCEIPSLNATDFLERLRGKKLVFVGDSLNRNMWESLVCILRASVTDKNRVYEISGRHEFKKKGFYAFRFEDYNCTIDFVSSPFLVQESTLNGKNGSIVETLRLDLMDRTTSMYHDADVLVFNTGHWWTHEKTSRGEDYYQEGNHVYPRLKVLDAYVRALSTWARWVDTNIDINKTQVIFRGYSVTHFKGGQWNSGGQCHKETEPIFNTSHLTKYPTKMRAFDNVLRAMKTPIVYLNISRLTDYRKDGHPSIYRMEYKSVEEQIAAERSQDCSHWCLPGVPDTWNELLYASLLKVGRGSWKV